MDNVDEGILNDGIKDKKKTGRPLGGKNRCAVCLEYGHNAKGCKVVLKAKTFKGVRNTLVENLQKENEALKTRLGIMEKEVETAILQSGYVPSESYLHAPPIPLFSNANSDPNLSEKRKGLGGRPVGSGKKAKLIDPNKL